jgi:hypothetical protein
MRVYVCVCINYVQITLRGYIIMIFIYVIFCNMHQSSHKIYDIGSSLRKSMTEK